MVMTQQPNPPLGGDEAKVEPVAWRARTPNGKWVLLNYAATARMWAEVLPLYAAPVLPVEVREKIARIVEGSVVRGEPVQPFDGPADEIDWSSWDFADAILSTIKGDA